MGNNGDQGWIDVYRIVSTFTLMMISLSRKQFHVEKRFMMIQFFNPKVAVKNFPPTRLSIMMKEMIRHANESLSY